MRHRGSLLLLLFNGTMVDILIVGQHPAGRDKDKQNREPGMQANSRRQRHLQAQTICYIVVLKVLKLINSGLLRYLNCGYIDNYDNSHAHIYTKQWIYIQSSYRNNNLT